MTLRSHAGSWHQHIFRSPALLYCVLLWLVSGALFLQWPIVVSDTDLWFHLSDGKYLFEHHAIPTNSFFSFVSPPVTYVHHAWLFDALVYLLYAGSGYWGLIVLRAALYLTTTFLVFHYLLRGHGGQQSHGWVAFIFVLTSSILLRRYHLVRPNMFDYVFIMAFLYILEHRPERAALLPVLAVLWCNLHGMYYPVMLLICIAYSAEYLLSRFKGESYPKGNERSFLLPLVLSMAAVFATPHHVRLLRLPFLPLTYFSSFTQELMPIGINAFSSFVISSMVPSPQTMLNLFLITAGLIFVQVCLSRHLRLSHALLCLGGTYLLLKANRFTYECTLLMLPLLSTTTLYAPEHLHHVFQKSTRFVLAGAFMVMPVLLLKSGFPHRPAYPFSSRGLPQGIVTFLNRINVGGTVLNTLNNGGYDRWMLSANYRIFMDMEDFHTDSFHLAVHAFTDKEALRKIVGLYHPTFITVPISLGSFKGLIQQFPEYVIVFFDDVEVLYMNAQRYPDLARDYELKGFDPFDLVGQEVETVLADDQRREALLRTLHRVLDIYPACGVANQLVAQTYNREGGYDRALPYAETIINTFPDSPTGYVLKGDSLKELRMFDRAAIAYRKAMARSPGEARVKVSKKLGAMLLDAHQPQEAYRVLQHTVDVVASGTTLGEAYQFGRAARLSGHRKIAEAVFVFLYVYKIAPEEVEWAEKVKRELTELGIDIEHPKAQGALSVVPHDD